MIKQQLYIKRLKIKIPQLGINLSAVLLARFLVFAEENIGVLLFLLFDSDFECE